MATIESDQSLRDHPKVAALARALGVHRREAIGLLHCLWWWAMDYAARDGRLDRWGPAAVADAVLWDGDPAGLVEALVATGWVDQDPLRLHEWGQHGARMLAQRHQEAEELEADRARARLRQHRRRDHHTDVTPMSRDCHTDVTPMSRDCHTDVTPMSRDHHTDVTPMSRDCHTDVTPMSRDCHTDVTPMSRDCHTDVTPMSREEGFSPDPSPKSVPFCPESNGSRPDPGSGDPDAPACVPAPARARPSTPDPALEAAAAEWYGAYPRHVGRQEALRAYRRAVANGAPQDDLLRAARHLADWVRASGQEQEYIQHPATCLNSGRWRDWIDGVPEGVRVTTRRAPSRVERSPEERSRAARLVQWGEEGDGAPVDPEPPDPG